MKIDSYVFGEMVIDGKACTTDLIIFPDRIDPSWWREEGHVLQLIDLKEVLAAAPKVLLIGTGYAGVLRVPEPLRNLLRSQGIELYVEKTGRAAELFNSLHGSGTVIAAFHLTC